VGRRAMPTRRADPTGAKTVVRVVAATKMLGLLIWVLLGTLRLAGPPRSNASVGTRRSIPPQRRNGFNAGRPCFFAERRDDARLPTQHPGARFQC
jgi:hypothetical protein